MLKLLSHITPKESIKNHAKLKYAYFVLSNMGEKQRRIKVCHKNFKFLNFMIHILKISQK